MDALKAEFKRLMEIAGWSQTEAGEKLGKTPGAINHLLNPDHPNRPTETTLRLMKMLIARERPDLLDAKTLEFNAKRRSGEFGPLSAKERSIIQRLRGLPRAEQGRIYAVINTMLNVAPKPKHPKGKKHGF